MIRLNQLYTVTDAAKMALDTVLPPWNLAVTNREEAFEELPKLIRRIVNYLASTGISDGVMADVKAITKKILGTRKAKPKTDTVTEETPGTETDTH